MEIFSTVAEGTVAKCGKDHFVRFLEDLTSLGLFVFRTELSEFVFQ